MISPVSSCISCRACLSTMLFVRKEEWKLLIWNSTTETWFLHLKIKWQYFPVSHTDRLLKNKITYTWRILINFKHVCGKINKQSDRKSRRIAPATISDIEIRDTCLKKTFLNIFIENSPVNPLPPFQCCYFGPKNHWLHLTKQ